MRAETNKAAEARALRARQQQQANIAGLTAANQAAVLAGPSPDTGQPYTQEEWELRERLRLEAVERRSRSLRSSPVAQSYRKLDSGGERTGKSELPPTPHPQKDEGAAAMQHALESMHTLTNSLEDEIAAEAQRRIKHCSPHSAERPPRRKPPRLFPPRLRPAPRRKITLFQRESKRRKTLRAGSVSMKARSSKRYSQHSLPATTQGRCWPWLPFPSTRRIANVSLSREGRGLSVRLRP